MPRDGSATRQRILAAAQRLVIDNGFRATTVDAVIAASGTSKGAFFHHFSSKQDLAEALVEEYVAADEIMAGTTGCLYTSVLAELELVQAGTSDPITKATIEWRDRYADLLAAALDGAGGGAGPGRRAGVDVDALADHVFVTFEGAYLLARATSDPAQMRRQLAVLRRLVESLLRP